MNSHNAKVEAVVKTESVEIDTDHKDVRILQSKLVDGAELAIDESFDIGCDPYNSTGQHVVIKTKHDTED